MSKKRLWFRAKQYGWGWTPATWEGWLALGLYVVYVITDTTLTTYPPARPEELYRLIPCIGLATVFLIWICYRTGEKPHWRWGK